MAATLKPSMDDQAFHEAMTGKSTKVFQLVMLAFFVISTRTSVNKYLSEEIVKEVVEEPRTVAPLPPVTLCMAPGFNQTLNMLQATDFSLWCPGEEDDVRACIERKRFKIEDILVGLVDVPSFTPSPISELSSFDYPTTLSLALGSCFTYHSKREGPFTQVKDTMRIKLK